MAAAAIPAIVLMVYIYRTDRLEPEPPQLLMRLVLAGIFSTFIAMSLEYIGNFALGFFFSEASTGYYAWLFFGVVGPAEEGAKYHMLKKRTWLHPAFNCQYDGVVYAVFVSMGFALAENIGYVFALGLKAASLRALTAIPGHACFGVFMGVWYGAAKSLYNRGKYSASKIARMLAVIIPSIIHGAYDFIAAEGHAYIFIVFIVSMFLVAFITARRMSVLDREIH